MSLEEKRLIGPFLPVIAEDLLSADMEGPFGSLTQNNCGWLANKALIVRFGMVYCKAYTKYIRTQTININHKTGGFFVLSCLTSVSLKVD